MAISLNKLVPKKPKVEKIINTGNPLQDKLDKFDNIISDYFNWKTNIVKLSSVLKDPDITDKQVADICKESLKIGGKTSVSTNSLLLAIFSCEKLNQIQVDSLLWKFNSNSNSFLLWRVDGSFFNSYHLSIYKNYTPSIKTLTENTRRNSIKENMIWYFPYIRKFNWNNKNSFNDIVNFYKNEILGCSDINSIDEMFKIFPEAFEDFTEKERITLFNNINSYKQNNNWNSDLHKYSCLETLFTANEMLKFWSWIANSYSQRVQSELKELNKRNSSSSNLCLWKLLKFDEKKQIVDNYFLNPTSDEINLIKTLIRWLSMQELDKNEDFKSRINLLIDIWEAPIPDAMIFSLKEDNIEKIKLSISANPSFYSLEKISKKLKLMSIKNPDINKLREIIAELAISNKEWICTEYLDLNAIKNNPKIIKELLLKCKYEGSWDYDKLYLYYLNGMDLSTIRSEFTGFTPPDGTAEKIGNVTDTTIDISSINFWKAEFDEKEFKALLSVTDKDKLLSIFAEGSLNWKKSLWNPINYANFLIALKYNNVLRETLDDFSHPLNKASIPNFRKLKKDILLALNGETFSSISTYQKLIYPIESLVVDPTNKSSIINFLKNLGNGDNIVMDWVYLEKIFNKTPLKDILYYIGIGNNFHNHPLLSSLINKFTIEFWTLPEDIKKIAIDKIILLINKANTLTISFEENNSLFDWKVMIDFLKLIITEKPKTIVSLKRMLNVEKSKNPKTTEYIKYIVDTIMTLPGYKSTFKKELWLSERDTPIANIIKMMSENNLVEKEYITKLWKSLFDNMDMTGLEKIMSNLLESTKEKAQKITKIKLNRNEYLWQNNTTSKERLKILAESFKDFPSESVNTAINSLLSLRDFRNKPSQDELKKIKDYILIWWGWLKLILKDNSMRESYWKELSLKFEQWYQTKDMIDLKKDFSDFEEVWTDEFVSFFKWFIYPTLTKMTITSIQKAKYLSTILSKDQFKAIIDSVK